MTVRKRFVAEITLTVSADGSTQTFYVASDGFTTLPTDTPANVYIPGTLKNAGTVERTLFTGPRVTGPITPNFGNIVILNPEQDQGEGLYDDWAGYGASGGRVVVRWGDETAAYPAGYTTVYIAYVHSLLADTREITLRLRDRMQLFDKPLVSEGFAGTGGLEGNGGVSKLKQWVANDPGFIEPILVDYVKQIYFVQSTGTWLSLHDSSYSTSQPINPFDVYENGVRIDRATTNYTSETELLSTAPALGEVQFYFGTDSSYVTGWKNGPVYFRLGTPPVGDLRVFPIGSPNDDIFNRYGSSIGSFNSTTLALMAGIPIGDIDTSLGISVSSLLVNDDRTFLEVLSDQATGYQGWFGFTRSDTFRAGYLLDPDGVHIYYGINEGVLGSVPSTASTSLYEFTHQGIQGFQRAPVSGMEAPIHSVLAAFGDTYPSQVNVAADDLVKDYLTRTPKYWSASGASSETLLANPGAISASVEGHHRFFQNNFGVRLWMERYFVLYGGRRNFYSFSCQMTPELLALDLHDVVTLKHHRFGLSAGKKHRIVGMTVDCSTAVPTIKFLLWGGERGRYTGTTNSTIPSGGGGGTPAATTEKLQALLGLLTQEFYGTVETFTSDGSTAGLTVEQLGALTQLFVGEITVQIAGSQYIYTDSSGVVPPTDGLTIPSHPAGSLLVLLSRAPLASGIPGTPTGWTSAATSPSVTFSNPWRLSWFYDTDGSETEVRSTNSTQCALAIYTGANSIGATSVMAETLGPTWTMPSLTLSVGDGTSWVGGFASHNQDETATVTDPTGLTPQLESPAALGGGTAVYWDSNGTVSSFSSATWSAGTAAYATAVIFEIVRTT